MTAKRLSRDALEFAPGLLSIQESPPPKLPRMVLYSVALLFGILLVWAIFGKLDVVATAEGRLVPQSYVKIVQPADSGVVREILVQEGETVEAGQVLMRLDAALSRADQRRLRNDLELARLQLQRIDAELAGNTMTRRPDDPPMLFRQVADQFQAHRDAYADALAEERAVREKTRQDLQGARERLRQLEKTLPIYRRSAEAVEKLAQKGYYSELAVEEKKRELIEQEQELKAQKATIAGLNATLSTSDRRLDQITSSYLSNLHDERVETESRLNTLREELGKATHKTDLLALKAPQKGIIKDLATHTVGTVVSPGTVLMTLVPDDDPLQAEVYVRNEDVGFVHQGQTVKLKLAAYPFQKYGMIVGTLVTIGADAVDPGSSGAADALAGQEGTSGLRYKALIRLDAQHLTTLGQPLEIAPGMQLTADIHLGYRTIMEYLLSPLQKAWLEAGRER